MTRFFAVAVAGGVHVARVVGDDVRALAREVVFEFLHRALVARNDRRGEHDGVGRLSECICAILLPIRASDANSSPCAPVARMMIFSGGYCVMFSTCDDRVVFVFDEAELARDLDVGAHERPSMTIFLPFLLRISRRG
jgi:hypothetical protein